jgi:nitroreductase
MQRIRYCAEKSGQGELGGYTEHFISTTVDAALMAQNVLLAAESAGLGGVFIGGIRNDPQGVCGCLQLPDLVYPVFGMCLGWPAQKNAVKPRMPLSMIVHKDSYDVDAIPAQVDAYDETMQDYYASRGANLRASNWSTQTAGAIQGKTREHMLKFLQQRGFLQR